VSRQSSPLTYQLRWRIAPRSRFSPLHYIAVTSTVVPIEIREVRAEEYEEAGRITASAWREFLPVDPHPDWDFYLAEISDIRGRAGRTVVLGAFEHGRPLGTVTLEVEQKIEDDGTPLAPNSANVRMLGVAPEARRRGVGRALMEATIAEARARGKRVLTLNTTEEMRSAVAMYEAMGFLRGKDLVFESGFRLQSYRLELAPESPPESG
jgi:GNAT superfamily N-acetyltransferase